MNADEIGDLRSKLANLQKKEFEIEKKIERLIQSGEQEKIYSRDVKSTYKLALIKKEEDHKAYLKEEKNDEAIASAMLEDVRKSVASLLNELPEDLSIKTDGLEKISNNISITLFTQSIYKTKYEMQILAAAPFKKRYHNYFFRVWIWSTGPMEQTVNRSYTNTNELVKDFATELAQIVHEINVYHSK